MSEGRLLALVARYPDQRALLRRVRDGSVFAGLDRLERRGLVRRQRERYRLTRSGRDAVVMTRAVTALVARTRLP
jgi:Mn-dependent DtxR family transcriptional regulator